MYQISIRSSFDFGEFVYEHLFRQAKSFDVKLPIGFPSLVVGILLSQKKGIMCADDVIGKVPSKLTISHKLFEGKHACDIVKPFDGTSFAPGDTLKLLLFLRRCRVILSKPLFKRSFPSKRLLTPPIAGKLCVKGLSR